MLIKKGDTSPVFPGANFTQDEIYRASFGNVGSSFTISDQALQGIQIIRNYYGVPFSVNASYRTAAHDMSKGRSGTGPHTKGIAIDIAPLKNKEQIILDYHQQVLNQGPLFQQLRAAGIGGFGLYDNFMHIDSRPSGSHRDSSGSYALWDNRITTKKKSHQ